MAVGGSGPTVLDAERKLAMVTAALRVAVIALRREGLAAPHAEGLAALAALTEDDQANLENTDLYEVAEIEAELRTWGALDSDSTWWLVSRVERFLLAEAAEAGRDGNHPLPPRRLEAAERTRERVAGWSRASAPFLAGYAAGYDAERKRGDALDREIAALRSELAGRPASGEPPVGTVASATGSRTPWRSEGSRRLTALGWVVDEVLALHRRAVEGTVELLADSLGWGSEGRRASLDRVATYYDGMPVGSRPLACHVDPFEAACDFAPSAIEGQARMAAFERIRVGYGALMETLDGAADAARVAPSG